MAPHRELPPGPHMRKPADGRPRIPELLIEKWLSQPHGGQLIESMHHFKLEGNFIKEGIANLADKVWLGSSESERENNEPALRMMGKRIAILTMVTGDYCKLTMDLGWDIDTVERTATILMPYFDIAERACYTYYGHPYRSMQYAEMILDSRGVSGDERALILLGVLLHDLGKVGVPGSLLRKAGEFTDGEKEIIRKHPEYGSIIINRVISGLSAECSPIRAHGNRIAEIAYTHHEQISGKGYPRRLVKDQIDIGGRVAGLCDSIDAMSSERIYLDVLPATFEEVVVEANKQLNKQFNGDLVQNFLDAGRCHAVRDRIFKIIQSAGGFP